jgi:hypothetical protein
LFWSSPFDKAFSHWLSFLWLVELLILVGSGWSLGLQRDEYCRLSFFYVQSRPASWRRMGVKGQQPTADHCPLGPEDRLHPALTADPPLLAQVTSLFHLFLSCLLTFF